MAMSWLHQIRVGNSKVSMLFAVCNAATPMWSAQPVAPSDAAFCDAARRQLSNLESTLWGGT